MVMHWIKVAIFFSLFLFFARASQIHTRWADLIIDNVAATVCAFVFLLLTWVV